ncbi:MULTISPECIES: hypothetical protein [unclassified Spirosoma]|uniref:hypothetical protein n=1 Tax=unclassified Spirosoma TaxID=2621999 RepID=UPI0009684B47|nr:MULTISPECIES: hypothetical protein [unclassified Spirosoma]MBN8826630.1 hypothetical protein [Spirosoma sp.]OJW74468.1 MAG: hypothetical protein BGO59_20675 [Spirosoma sp. 48-14]
MNPTVSYSWLRSVLLLVLTGFGPLYAQSTSLQRAVVLVSPSISLPMRETAPQMLREEIAKRTGITLPTRSGWPANTVRIAFVLTGDKDLYGQSVPTNTDTNRPEAQPEGFRIVSETGTTGTTLWVIGADSRGILFGTGWLLRNLQMRSKQLDLTLPINIATAPAYPIRGHQLGYRTTANSYDAWTVAQFDQYIRELAIFGTNAVEGIPFHEDENPSPHFKIPAAEMRIRLSEICQKYDLDYWVWTPATFSLTDIAKRSAELDLHETFYRSCPRLDHIFVPGGDPGDNHPKEVMPFLKDLHTRLIKYHPKAKIWLSLQGFSVEQVDYFYGYLAQYKPDWLAGVVYGPSSPSLSETRYRLPQQYQIRQYPDITHNVRCEFPVARWDQAYALTLGREATNPRPYFYASVQAAMAPFTNGFVSYSDGCHDDVNKVIWSMRGWQPDRSVYEILEEYGRFFFKPELAAPVADGIAALEHNWQGPLAENGGVEATFTFWKQLETAHPQLATNWRWQLFLLRAYYDTYTRRRLLYEQALEQKANTQLALADKLGTEVVINQALALVNQADTKPISPELRQKIETLCADLFTSIGLQTSVPKYKAKGYERGCLLDFVDYPLNNRWWLADEFPKVKAMKTPDEQLARLTFIAHWESPGKGSFYDDVSSISKGPRIKTISDDATDIAWWQNGSSRARLSSQTFQRCPALDYMNLDPGSRYIIRVVGFGEALLRVDGQRLEPTVYNREADTVKEWIVPLWATQDGRISVTFDQPEESHLNWRQNSRISDIWLLKESPKE